MELYSSDKKAVKPLLNLDIDWEDVTCSICLDSPHNGVLLQCSSYDKGCRPFMCDTDQKHSNCLERFKCAYRVPAVVQVASATNGMTIVCIQEISSSPSIRPICPLCRGDVTGWLIIDAARLFLNTKERCCEEKDCAYVGNFSELQKHAQLKHPHSCPSEIDPMQKSDWDNFQQSSDIIDVLSTIHAEVPRGMVFGDFVIEYGDSEVDEEYEEFRRSRSSWWSSCISCRLFPKFTCSRSQRRSRAGVQNNQGLIADDSNAGEGFSFSDAREYRFSETDNELARTGVVDTPTMAIPSHYRWS